MVSLTTRLSPVEATLAIIDAESGLHLDTTVVMVLHTVLHFTRFARIMVPRFRGATTVELVQ